MSDAFLDYIGETSKQSQQVMREYEALLKALLQLVQETQPELSWVEAWNEARRRYQAEYQIVKSR